MLKVGLLGAGRIGKVHAKAIGRHPASTLVAVADAVSENATALATEYGCTVNSVDQIIADAAIDAVLIASPTDTHADLIEAATEAGKAVFCEKPVDLSLDRAKACLAAIGSKSDSIMLGFNRRFDPGFSALKASADAGEIGKAELLSITSYDPAPPPANYIQASGGLFRDMMIHDFDMANFIMGDIPLSITAIGTSLVDPEIGKLGDVDTAVATLRYADGKITVIQNSRRAVYGYDQRLELLGSEGQLQIKNVLENTVVKSTADGVTGANPLHFFLERYMPAYEIEWAAFVDALVKKSKMPVTLRDGVVALAMAEAATQSAESGQPIDVQRIP